MNSSTPIKMFGLGLLISAMVAIGYWIIGPLLKGLLIVLIMGIDAVADLSKMLNEFTGIPAAFWFIGIMIVAFDLIMKGNVDKK